MRRSLLKLSAALSRVNARITLKPFAKPPIASRRADFVFTFCINP